MIDKILRENRRADSLQALRQEAANGARTGFSLEEGLLLHEGRLVVPDNSQLRTLLIREVHNQVSCAHPGRGKTLKLLTPRYYWPRMKADVEQYIRNCHACKRASSPRDKTPGLLKPLAIPDHPWQHVTMDFNSFSEDKHGYDSVFVVMDRLSKQSISILCFKTYNAPEIAKLYITYIYRYYRAPELVVSDRGP